MHHRSPRVVLRNLDELSHTGDAIHHDVDDVRPRRRNVAVRRHGDRDGLRRLAGPETGVVEEYHPVSHVDGVSDEATIVESDLDTLSGRGSIEADGELGAVGVEVLAGKDDVAGTGGVSLEVRRGVDLVAELGGEGVLRGRLEDRHLDGVGAGDEEGTVEEEEGDAVVQAGDRGPGAAGEALALGLGGVIDQDVEGGLAGELEALGALFGAVDPDDGAVGEEGTFDHTAGLGHRVHFPFGVGVEGVDAAAGGVARGSDVLVRTATADDNIRIPVVLAGEGQDDGATGVGVSAVIARKIGERLDNSVGVQVKVLRRLGSEDEHVTVLEEMDEGIHVIWLVLLEDFHGDAPSLGRAVTVENLIGGIVVLRLGRVEAVQTSRSDEDLAVSHDLGRRVPASSVKPSGEFLPIFAVERAISCRAPEVANTLEAISDSGIKPVQGAVATERAEAAIG